MNELIITHIDAHMAHLGAALLLGEKDQIAHLKLRLGDADGLGILGGGGMGKGDPELGEHMHGEAGAVEAALGAPAVNIFAAQQRGGVVDDLLPRAGSGRSRPAGGLRCGGGAGGRSGGSGRCAVIACKGDYLYIFRRDITGLAVILDLEPAGVDADDLGHCAGGQLGEDIVLRAWACAQIQGGGSRHLRAAADDVHHRLRLDILGAHIAHIAVVGHLIPVVLLIQDGHPGAVVELVQNGALGGGLLPEVDGGGGGDGAALHIKGKGGDCHGGGNDACGKNGSDDRFDAHGNAPSRVGGDLFSAQRPFQPDGAKLHGVVESLSLSRFHHAVF